MVENYWTAFLCKARYCYLHLANDVLLVLVCLSLCFLSVCLLATSLKKLITEFYNVSGKVRNYTRFSLIDFDSDLDYYSVSNTEQYHMGK